VFVSLELSIEVTPISLIDLGINPKVINSAINVAIAQRLLRKVCSACVVQETIPEKTKEAIKKELANAPNKPDNLQFEVMPKAVGCDKCSGLGYKGRIGILEANREGDWVSLFLPAVPDKICKNQMIIRKTIRPEIPTPILMRMSLD
jgi:hypothetical protein